MVFRNSTTKMNLLTKISAFILNIWILEKLICHWFLWIHFCLAVAYQENPFQLHISLTLYFQSFLFFLIFFLWFYIADFHLCDGSRQTFLFWLMFRWKCFLTEAKLNICLDLWSDWNLIGIIANFKVLHEVSYCRSSVRRDQRCKQPFNFIL